MNNLIHTFRRSFVTLASVIVLCAAGLAPATAFAATSTNSKLAPCSVKNSNPAHPTKTETIGFSTIKNNDGSLPTGQTNVVRAGHTGKRLITYTATYKKGKLTSCRHTGTKVTVQPLNSLESVGTYVAPTPAPTSAPVVAPQPNCTNGTYVNSAGNTVCSPESAPTAPAGATAQCVDGTYSFSQSHSGTCSHHGGVSSWL